MRAAARQAPKAAVDPAATECAEPRSAVSSARWAVCIAVGLLVSACAGRIEVASTLNPDAVGDREFVQGAGFRHQIIRRGDFRADGVLHVYLEGDGTPWVTRTRIARDPTPRTPLALRLMAMDPAPSLYLGRPCYHGLAQSPGCTPWLWTHGRYGEEVVASMAAAIRNAVGDGAQPEIDLIGYSGGGVLAMLLAERLGNVRQVVTVAGNLDIDAWADYNGYTRLRGSINPATRPALAPGIRQVHLAGEDDRRVPAWIGRRGIAGQPNARFVLIPDFDHRCCWERVWPSLLEAIMGQNGVTVAQALAGVADPASERR